MKKSKTFLNVNSKKKSTKKNAFTLIELIVVIIILSILGTIAFISIQGYSKTARNAKRIADINNIKTALELFILNTGFYPLPDNGKEVLYSGDLLRTQGTVGEIVKTNLSRNMPNLPLDPLLGTEYIYSITNTQKEFEVLNIIEGDLGINNNLIISTYAVSAFQTKIEGTYNQIYVETPRYIVPVPSIINADLPPIDLKEKPEAIKSVVVTNGPNIPGLGSPSVQTQTGELDINLFVYTGSISADSTDQEKKEVLKIIRDAYEGTSLASQSPYSNILDTTNPVDIVNNLIINEPTTTPTPVNGAALLTQSDCEFAGWEWVDWGHDVYIGTNQGDGFCISPSFGDWQTNGPDLSDGAGGISFNGWGNESEDYYNGWNASSVGDSGNLYPEFGQTRSLNSEVSYDCKVIGGAGADFDSEDTIVGRMKWLASTGNSYTEARSIDWITGLVPHTTGTNPHAIPALFIADCIDGVKDLTNSMTYTHVDDSTEEITYGEYSANVSSNVDLVDLSGTTYQNRQKYLTAWTQVSGSHLPSAFSYISDGYAGAEDSDGNDFTGKSRGEYQVACDDGVITDNSNDEWVWLSAIGNTDGTMWGRLTRVTGKDGCGNQTTDATGSRDGFLSARFIVRP